MMTRWPVGRSLGGMRLLLATALGFGLAGGAQRALADCMPTNGGVEICDGIDNDCNGIIDDIVPAPCLVGDPPGCDPSRTCLGGSGNCMNPPFGPGCTCTKGTDCQSGKCAGASCCISPGLTACSGGVQVCNFDNSKGQQKLAVPEGPNLGGPAVSPLCYDGLDNDCNGLTDTMDPACFHAELCNGRDDDGDGGIDEPFVAMGLGMPCTVGLGICQRTGVFVCNATQDGIVCSASPGTPQAEGPNNGGPDVSPTCYDGLDNDCDGLVDTQDPECQHAELCNGLDDNGNGVIDEGFDVGAPCTSGVGACQTSGTKVCSADHLSTVCNAVPGLGSPEGPSGPTCSDGIDNDCDGFTDLADPKCNSALLAATCSLTRTVGDVSGCNGSYTIHFGATGAAPGAVVTALLEARDVIGEVGQTIPVMDGDIAFLQARNHGDVRIKSTGNIHRMRAAVPVLHVTVQDGLNKAEAFCSTIPFLKVVEPCCEITSGAAGDLTPVTVAIPLNDPHGLHLKIDGVDILAALGIDPATQFPGGPFSGMATINGKPVTISDLFVRSNPGPSANTMTFKYGGIGCGGHLTSILGTRIASVPPPKSTLCSVYNLRDKAVAESFGVEITRPVDQQVVSDVPTHVTGRACGGRHMARVLLNGRPLDTSGQVVEPGDGKTSADTYVIPIDEMVGQVDLDVAATTGLVPIGVFDPGSNRLAVEADDDLGNRTFKNLIFAIGNVQKPGVGPLAAVSPQQVEAEARVREAVENALGPSVADVQNALAVGLSPGAVNTLFQAKCKQAGDTFLASVRTRLLGGPLKTIHVDPDCSCSTDVPFSITSIDTDPPNAAVACPVTFKDHKFSVHVGLPNLVVGFAGANQCEDDFIVCIDRTVVDIAGSIEIRNIALDFDVTEAQLGKPSPPGGGGMCGTPAPAPPPCNNGVIDPGEMCDPSVMPDGCPAGEACNPQCTACFAKGMTDMPVFTKKKATVECIGGDICEFFAGIIDAIVKLFGGNAGLGGVNVNLTDIPQPDVGACQPDPTCSGEVKPAPQNGPVQVDFSKLDRAVINPSGMEVIFDGRFSVSMPDPEVANTPGPALTNPVAPIPPVSGAQDATVLLSEDTMNQILAGLTQAGTFKSLFEPLAGMGMPSTIGDLLKFPTLTTGQKNLLIIVLNALHLSVNTPILLHGRVDVSPNLLITDDPTTLPVEAVLRLPKVSFEVIADRNNSGTADGAVGTIPMCSRTNTDTTHDCELLQLCVDLEFFVGLQFQTCMDGRQGIVLAGRNALCTGPSMPFACCTAANTGTCPGLLVPQDQIQKGMLCSAATPAQSNADQTAIQNAAGSSSADIVMMQAQTQTPPICTKGLDFKFCGTPVQFVNPKLIAVDTDGALTRQEFLGVTGQIVP